MAHQVKWKFKGTEVYFVSDKDKLTRDVLRHRNKLNTTKKIEIVNEFFSLADSNADCASCNRHTTVDPQPTVSVDSEQASPESEAFELLGVFIDVGTVDPSVDPLSGYTSDSMFSSLSDGLDSEPVR